MSYNILVVDDSPIIRAVIKKSIAMAGIDAGKIFEAQNGKDALRVLGEEWVDMVFADIHMPEMNGLELVEQMAKDSMLVTVPVVIVSSDRSEVQINELKKRGIRAFIKKPFGPEDLREVVRAILGSMAGGEHA